MAGKNSDINTRLLHIRQHMMDARNLLNKLEDRLSMTDAPQDVTDLVSAIMTEAYSIKQLTDKLSHVNGEALRANDQDWDCKTLYNGCLFIKDVCLFCGGTI